MAMPVKTGNPSTATLPTKMPTGTFQRLIKPLTKMVPTTPVSEPLDLLALFTGRMAHPNDERNSGRHQGACGHDATCDSYHPHNRAIDAVGVGDLWEVFERTGLKRVACYAASDPKSCTLGQGPPAG